MKEKLYNHSPFNKELQLQFTLYLADALNPERITIGKIIIVLTG